MAACYTNQLHPRCAVSDHMHHRCRAPWAASDRRVVIRPVQYWILPDHASPHVVVSSFAVDINNILYNIILLLIFFFAIVFAIKNETYRSATPGIAGLLLLEVYDHCGSVECHLLVHRQNDLFMPLSALYRLLVLIFKQIGYGLFIRHHLRVGALEEPWAASDLNRRTLPVDRRFGAFTYINIVTSTLDGDNIRRITCASKKREFFYFLFDLL